MSLQLSNAAAKHFDDQVKVAYGSDTKTQLASTVYKKMNRGVKTFQFPTMTSGVATKRVTQTKVNLMNIGHGNKTATGEGWEAAEFTDIFDDAETNIEEKVWLAQIIAGAINRRSDQIIYDALEVATGTLTTVSVNTGGANSGLNVDKLREAMGFFDDREVTEADRHYVGQAVGKSQLLAETEVTSTDFNTARALVRGTVNSFLGFTFHWIGTRAEGGIKKVGNVRENFAYHGGMGGSIGFGVIMENDINVTYENLYSSWLSNQGFDAGAVVRDAEGVVPINTFEA